MDKKQVHEIDCANQKKNEYACLQQQQRGTHGCDVVRAQWHHQ